VETSYPIGNLKRNKKRQCPVSSSPESTSPFNPPPPAPPQYPQASPLKLPTMTNGRSLSSRARSQLRDAKGRFCCLPEEASEGKRGGRKNTSSPKRSLRSGRANMGASSSALRGTGDRDSGSEGDLDDFYNNLPSGDGYGRSNDDQLIADDKAMIPGVRVGKGKERVKGPGCARALEDEQVHYQLVSAAPPTPPPHQCMLPGLDEVNSN
jgi:hypothetical protein